MQRFSQHLNWQLCVWRPFCHVCSPGPRRGMAASMDFSSGGVTEADLASLEDAIRDAVREKRSVYEGSKEMLLRLFK